MYDPLLKSTRWHTRLFHNMYEKYTTGAIVLGAADYGEYDKRFTLYTRDFGLVNARASAVRKMESKMRQSFALFSHTSVSLVRGAHGWRAVGARALVNHEMTAYGVHTYARISHLITRLVHGEEKHEYLFDVLNSARDACAQKGEDALGATELLCVARILYALGYLTSGALTTALLMHTQFADEDIKTVLDVRKDLLGTVNKAMAETQL